MKKLIAVAVAAMALSYPLASYAAGVSVNATSTTSAGTTSASTTANAGASLSLSSKSTFKQVIASASTADMASLDFSNVGPKTHIHIVKLSKLKGYWSANASMTTSAAITANRTSLDASVAANADLVVKLKAAGFTSDQVVAESSTKSSVTLFVADKG